MYIENPKSKGSGILSCVPHQGRCPHNCPDCFYNAGRSYLEPLDQNTPNIPPLALAESRVVRVNDGHDSCFEWPLARLETKTFPNKFYNTSVPDLSFYDAPVVLTVNPGEITDTDFFKLEEIPKNLMFVRVRANSWNVNEVITPAVDYYTLREVPVVLTFMAYHDISAIPETERGYYIERKRTSNVYWAIGRAVYKDIMGWYETNKWVYSCGSEGQETRCRWCGNCLREYFATIERIRV